MYIYKYCVYIYTQYIYTIYIYTNYIYMSEMQRHRAFLLEDFSILGLGVT